MRSVRVSCLGAQGCAHVCDRLHLIRGVGLCRILDDSCAFTSLYLLVHTHAGEEPFSAASQVQIQVIFEQVDATACLRICSRCRESLLVHKHLFTI